MHRVKNSSSKHRISAPFFFQPRLDCVIKPLDDVIANESPGKDPSTKLAHHKPFKFGEYVLDKFQKSYGDNQETGLLQPERLSLNRDKGIYFQTFVGLGKATPYIPEGHLKTFEESKVFFFKTTKVGQKTSNYSDYSRRSPEKDFRNSQNISKYFRVFRCLFVLILPFESLTSKLMFPM